MRRKARSTKRDPHLDFVASLPCCVCGRRPAVPAHLRFDIPAGGNKGGMGKKPGNENTVPLDHPCHERQHRAGERTFWADVGKDPHGLAAQLFAVTGDLAAGYALVIAFLQGEGKWSVRSAS